MPESLRRWTSNVNDEQRIIFLFIVRRLWFIVYLSNGLRKSNRNLYLRRRIIFVSVRSLGDLFSADLRSLPAFLSREKRMCYFT